MTTNRRLSPNSVAPGDFVNVLVLGSEGAGKHDIAKCLETMAPSLDLRTHTYTSLPLPEGSSLYRLGVQYICFVVDLVSQDSLETLLSNMGQVDIGYFLGRSTIIANTKAVVTYEANNMEKLKRLAAKYGIPVLFRNTEVESERTNLGRTLIGQIKLALGCVPGVSPILFSGSGGSSGWDSRTAATTP